jgi:hypothetical protein
VAGDLQGRLARLIGDLGQWTLPGPAWRRVGEQLAALETALHQGDQAGVAAAVDRLELLSPVRLTRLGQVPVLPADRQVRERLNRVRAATDGPPPAARSTDGGRGE